MFGISCRVQGMYDSMNVSELHRVHSGGCIVPRMYETWLLQLEHMGVRGTRVV